MTDRRTLFFEIARGSEHRVHHDISDHLTLTEEGSWCGECGRDVRWVNPDNECCADCEAALTPPPQPTVLQRIIAKLCGDKA